MKRPAEACYLPVMNYILSKNVCGSPFFLLAGYSVDSTLFLLHAFTHGCGATREARMTEGMLMMGCPVANGMLSTLLAVFYLVGSTKFVLIAFFRMMVLVSSLCQR